MQAKKVDAPGVLKLELGSGFYRWNLSPWWAGTTPTRAEPGATKSWRKPLLHPSNTFLVSGARQLWAMWHDRVGEKQTCRSRAPEDLAWLRRVRDRIDREHAQPLDVEALARGAHMSAGHLSRRFRRAYGESPYAYLITRRIERAMALLRRGDLSVTEVCFAVGCSHSAPSALASPSWSVRRRASIGDQAARATAGTPSCVAKQVTRPIRNREVRARSRK